MIAVEDKYKDQTHPINDFEHLARNYILIASEGVEVPLEHLKKRSIVIIVEDRLTTNTLLDQVGNAGI